MNGIGPSPDRPRLRTIQRQSLHPSRPRSFPPSPLHASSGCDPLQPGHENQVSGPHHRQQAAQGRHYRRHAEARNPRQRTAPRTANLDAKARLTNTDTQAPGWIAEELCMQPTRNLMRSPWYRPLRHKTAESPSEPQVGACRSRRTAGRTNGQDRPVRQPAGFRAAKLWSQLAVCRPRAVFAGDAPCWPATTGHQPAILDPV